MVLDLATIVRKEVVEHYPADQMGGPFDHIFWIASQADEFPEWGQSYRNRDWMLRRFWPREPIFASALGSVVERYAAFGWKVEGPPRTANMSRRMLNMCQDGKGLEALFKLMLLDSFTQDNGAFAGISRVNNNDPTSPVVNLYHLDAAKCFRTGNPMTPVYYWDRLGKAHALNYWQVMVYDEMSCPIEEYRGQNYCVLTRCLRAAQILRDIAVYKSEKLSGRYHRAIHLVSGVQTKTIQDAMDGQKQIADGMGLTRYLQPLIVASLDPTSRVTHEQIDLASLPDGFDEETTMRWYINQLALAFGSDYQDFAPLPGNNIGSSGQSEVMHLKSRGKGAASFMRTFEIMFNMHGIMPDTVTFSFGEQDVAENMDRAKVQMIRAQGRAMRVASGEITAAVAAQEAVDVGDMPEAYLKMMGLRDETGDVILNSST
jgi:hypothetical protein